uniref:Uncharacterized protein n=1 Tax=Timema douglasi TaxID=61478 RepID=A0A7R8ZBI4_TIMDO|nr:unnamed protein product [Timema douglasi]
MRGHVVIGNDNVVNLCAGDVTVVLLTSHQLHASLKKLASNRFRSRHGIGGSNKSPTYRRAGIHKNKHQSNMWQRSHGHDLHPPRKVRVPPPLMLSSTKKGGEALLVPCWFEPPVNLP